MISKTYQGEEWKALRRRFNPGFAPQHLMTLLPSIMDKASIFLNRLDDLARTGETFSLQGLATNLTFDVIGSLVLDIDMTTYAERSKSTKPRSILSISLQDIKDLSPETVDVTCDQLSSFLFAGHDTTSTTIAWMFYELSRTPHALRAVRAELDDLLGPDASPAAVAARLLAPGGEQIVHPVILRLWPPGATARMTKPGDGLKVTLRTSSNPTGETSAVDLGGLLLYHIHSIIQRDPSIFGETADTFIQHDTADKIPAGAWRAFERGPRNCIGQELATIEARVVIALVARRYDFTKVGIGAVSLDSATGEPELGKNGQYKVSEEMYMALANAIAIVL
ncbi:hypothetical protein VP1G_06949 [Cytospora mali]|uniref:Uncharacterized protein n=1 Tax=Cytospora mali TaxID=578113 RepID=A0A194V721_CYTMA|nr:hypothetical protein VP1G_06949 [Valsa mali var. pyri (nom. inval.)]